MWIDEFVQYIRYEKNFSTHTVVAYRHDLEQFFEFIKINHDAENPDGIEPDMIRSWMIDLLENKHTSRTVNRKLSCLKSYWHFLLRRGLATKTPVKRVLSPKTKKALPVFLKENEMSEILNQEETRDNPFENARDRLIIEMFYQTGMRLAELIGLNDENVDTGTGLLRVTGKRNKQRLIPFGNRLKDGISEYLQLRNENVNSETESFFVRKNGKRLYPQMVYKIVQQKLTKVATLSKNSPHVLRHTFATTMLNKGAELNAVKELLGHSSLSATEVYTHTTFEELKKVYKQAHPRA